MKLLILGASGGVGRQLVAQAVGAGHQVTALVRDSSDWRAPSGITTERGEVLQAGVLDRLVPGHDAVLSALGQRRVNLIPWSRLLSPPDLMQQVVRLLIPAMESAEVRRLLVVSAAGVGDSAPAMNPAITALVRSSKIGTAYADLHAMEQRLHATTLDWTALRPVTLSNGRRTGRARIVERFGMTSVISRADVADWMLAHLGGCDARTPMIGLS